MPAPTYPVYFSKPSQPAFTSEVAQGPAIPAYPIGERRPDALVWQQRFWQVRSSYARPTSNIQNCDADATARFIDDTGFRPVGIGDLVEWVRTWATVPGQIIDYETYAYTYPGYTTTLAGYGRIPWTAHVTSKLTLDFYLVGAGGSYSDAGSIPVTAGQTYLYPPYTGSVPAEYLSASSTPTHSAYAALVSTDAGSASSYSIEAHDSILEPYMGNIWRRSRRHVKAR